MKPAASKTILIVGAALVLGLNARRDLTQTARRYQWATVSRGVLAQTISTPGVMEAVNVVEIPSEVTETVLKKLAQEGQAVKTGQPLLELSRAHTQLDFEQRRNAYVSAQAETRKATRELEIQKKLLKNLAASRSQVEDAAQACEKAAATFKIAERELDLERKRLDGTTVRSPLDGVVLRDYTKLDADVKPGDKLIAVGDISRFVVRAAVDELDIQNVQPAQAADIDVDAFPGKTMKGKVSSIASQADRDTFAKIQVVIDITDAAGVPLKHNLSVRTRILTSTIADAIGVPIKAVRDKQGDSGRLLVRSRWGLVREKWVTLGRLAGDAIEVTNGLHVGDRVAVSERPPDAR